MDEAEASTSGRSPVQEAWQVEYLRTLPEVERLYRLRAQPWPLQVMRSSQLDAQRLDGELHAMLHEQFMRIFTHFHEGRVSAFEPELNAVLGALVFWLSVWQRSASPGSELMNLRYRNEAAMEQAARNAAAAASSTCSSTGATPQRPPWLHGGSTGVAGPGLNPLQSALLAAGWVLLPYIWARTARSLAQQPWPGDGGPQGGSCPGGAWRWLQRLDAAYQVASAVNLAAFLWQGKYRTLLERVLRARLVYQRPIMSRLVSFEYLNRQLVWQELSEFLLFVLPLLNVPRIKRWVLAAFPRVPAMGGGDGGGAAAPAYAVASPDCTALQPSRAQHTVGQLLSFRQGGGSRADEEEDLDEAEGASATSLRVPGPCPICGVAEVLVPYVALPCRHVYCYYCLRANTEADVGFCCLLDGHRVAAMRRLLQRRRAVPAAGSGG